jgi:DNA polymerase-1
VTETAQEFVGDIDFSLPWFLEARDPSVYLTAPWLLLDLETKNHDKGDALNQDNTVVCAAWATSEDQRIEFCRGNEFEQHRLIQAVQDTLDAGGFLVAHNIKFELAWLARMGIDLYQCFTYDTMIGEYVIGGNLWQYQHLSLDKLDKKYGGKGKAAIIDRMMKGGVCPSEMPRDLLEARVRQDVAQTYRIWRKQLKRLVKRKQLHLAYTRNLLTPALTWIESRGMAANEARVYEEYEKAHAEMIRLQREFDKLTGGVNWRSAPQKAHAIYGSRAEGGMGFKEITKNGRPLRGKPHKQFPDGMPKTDDDTLAKLTASNKRQEKFLDLLKQLQIVGSRLSKTLAFLRGIVDEYDGIFYGTFNQTATQTHRLSSSGRRRVFESVTDKTGKPKALGVQFQNFPRDFKDLIQAKRPDWKVGESDGSQLEFRVAAYVGNDTKAKWNIRNGVDQHKHTASVLLDKPAEEVTKAERQNAKEDTFKPLYGGQRGTKAQERYYEWFAKEFPELRATQEGWTHTVLEKKRLRLPWGIEFYWPRTRMSRNGYIDNTANIFNYPIQSLATAEIIPIAVVYLWHRIRAQGSEIELINTVHDSAIAEIPPGEEEMWQRLSVQAFTLDVYDFLENVYKIDFDVPLGVESGAGSRWNSEDTESIELNVESDGTMWRKA